MGGRKRICGGDGRCNSWSMSVMIVGVGGAYNNGQQSQLEVLRW